MLNKVTGNLFFLLLEEFRKFLRQNQIQLTDSGYELKKVKSHIVLLVRIYVRNVISTFRRHQQISQWSASRKSANFDPQTLKVCQDENANP